MNEVIKQFDTMRRSNSLPSRRVVKNSRFLLDRDEVHLCILCFRAIMNYQYGLTECVRNFSLNRTIKIRDWFGPNGPGIPDKHTENGKVTKLPWIKFALLSILITSKQR